MKIKKMIDADELKEKLAHTKSDEAIKIVEEMQGYCKFYVLIVRRRYGKEAHTPVEEIPENEYRYLVSVMAKNEAQARKRIKERLEKQIRSQRKHEKWEWLTFKFIDKEYVNRLTYRKPEYIERYGCSILHNACFELTEL